MTDSARFAVYLSHSWWPEDVELNLQVWRAFASDVELLVDAPPKEPDPNPPYYINRIEELLRRSDVFVSVLTYRPPKVPGAKLKCSPYSHFEIQLAERANLPRLVLYDRQSGFRPPEMKTPWAVYQAFDREEGGRLPEQGQWRKVVERAISGWLDWVRSHRKPSSYELSTDAAVLLDRGRDGALVDELARALDEAGFKPGFFDERAALTGHEALRYLRDAGLVIADLGAREGRLSHLYAAAHGYGVPAIRLLRGQEPLPWLVGDVPGGYGEDVVRWNTADEVRAQVDPRINAMRRLSPALRDDDATRYLQSKRYAKYSVFLSHTARDDQPTLIERVCAELKARQVPLFEYNDNNTAGIDWRADLDAALAKTTHFVVLLTEHYEQSEMCTFEIEHVVARGTTVSVLPFLAGERTRPHPKLKVPHHAPLRGLDAEVAATTIVEQVIKALDEANRRPRA